MSIWYAVTDFIGQGGSVLWILFFTCLLLWLLILERTWFLRIAWPVHARQLITSWRARPEQSSWQARQIRQAILCEASLALNRQIPLIRVLVALCPLIGLLGTVLGMIGVFEVIAASGNDDAQAMARGVYRATIPTMAGLVVALTGIYFTVRLHQLAQRCNDTLRDAMAIHGERHVS